MSISTDSWTTVQLSRSHLQASLDFQKAFIDNKESKKSMSELNKFFAEEVSDTIQELVLASLFSLSTVAGSAFVLSVFSINMVKALGEDATNLEYNQLEAGYQILKKLLDYLNSNSSYQLVEVTLRKRTYTDPTSGQRIGMIIGNKGYLEDAYEIKRVKLTNGTWLQK